MKPVLWAEVGMRMRCANKAQSKCEIIQVGKRHRPNQFTKSEVFVGVALTAEH